MHNTDPDGAITNIDPRITPDDPIVNTETGNAIIDHLLIPFNDTANLFGGVVNTLDYLGDALEAG